MDKAKFYAQINQYFNSDVMSLASGTPCGRTIPGSQVVDYSLLCITKIVEGERCLSMDFSS